MSEELVLIRGLPGSGKTTCAREFVARGFSHFEADMYFEDEAGAYRFDASRLADAHAWCVSSTKLALFKKQNCVVSNTFTRKWEMQPYLSAAKATGAAVRVLVCNGAFKSVHNVPDEAMRRMRERWEE
jgi:predicted kinase